jgi:hypothetical protein
MMAGPTAPGRVLRVYQPATDVVGGTWTVPWAVRPRVISRVLTPTSGMVSAAGAAIAAGRAVGAAATIGPVGAGNAATWAAGAGRRPLVPCRVSSPHVPASATASPAQAIAAHQRSRTVMGGTTARAAAGPGDDRRGAGRGRRRRRARARRR